MVRESNIEVISGAPNAPISINLTKDFCVDEFNSNELQTEKKTRAKQDLTAKIEDLESTIKGLTEAIDSLKSEVAEMQVQMKRAGEDREKENKEASPAKNNSHCLSFLSPITLFQSRS
jgi:TolA-binding protein